MELRPCAQFRSTLPSDRVEDDERILRQGGRNIAKAAAELLRKLGCEVEEPEDAGDHGWEFNLRRGDRKLWCQITEIEDYLLLLEEPRGWSLFRKKGPTPEYLDVLRGLAREMAADPRFVDVRWMTSDQAFTDHPGSADPVG